MEALLIDDAGQSWPRSSARLRQLHAFDGSDPAFARYCVKTLGFVEVRFFPKGNEILLDANSVSRKAMESLLYLICGLGQRTFVLTPVDGKPGSQQVVAGNQKLVRLLSDFTDKRATVAEGFLARRIELEGTRLGPSMSTIAERLRSAGSLAELRRLCACLIGERYTLTRPSLSGARLLIAGMGDGYKFLDRGWDDVARGWAFEDVGDYDYGRWVSAAHQQALMADAAEAHDVDAFVEWPRLGRLRTRYERILLPFTTLDGVRWVLSTSAPRNDIDLRARA